MPFTFESTALAGVVIIDAKLFGDARGFLMETFKRSEFEAAGLPVTLVQENHSLSGAGTLRGLHYQRDPKAQGKLVRVIRGGDLRCRRGHSLRLADLRSVGRGVALG